MRKLLLLTLISAPLFLAQSAYAVCPICTVAVGAGVGLSRWLGIDDTITGLWIGGLVISLAMWTIAWFKRKNIRFIGESLAVFLGYYALIVIPLYFMGIIGHPLNRFLGLDKLIWGIVFGSIAFYLGAQWYNYLKKQNHGHAQFPFQKVVMPIAPLIVLSIIFYFLTK